MQDRLDFLVGIPVARLLFQDQIGTHASAGEVSDAFVVFGAVGMSVEVARTGIGYVFQELHQPKRGFQVGRAEAEILIVAARTLVIKVDVEEFACFPCLGDAVHKVGFTPTISG